MQGWVIWLGIIQFYLYKTKINTIADVTTALVSLLWPAVYTPVAARRVLGAGSPGNISTVF